MIRAFENNTLGLVLASICGGLLLIVLVLIVLWAMPPSAGPGDEESADADISADIASLQSAEPLEKYAVVSERPVFNEDRRPAPVQDPDEIVEVPTVEDVQAPDVELAGVVITPSLRMATLRSKDNPQSLVAFEGKPLEGDFGSWQVSRIEERMVILASEDGEEMQLELQIHDAVIKEPPEPARADDDGETDETGQDSGEADQVEALSRAEEIRQRIEERREELRRAAEQRDEEQAQNYRDAIQSMIQRRQERTQEQQAEEEG